MRTTSEKRNGQKRTTDQHREPLPAPLPALSAGVTIGSSFFFARSLALPGHMYVNIYDFADYSIITYSGSVRRLTLHTKAILINHQPAQPFASTHFQCLHARIEGLR